MTDITGDLDLLGDWLDAKGYTEEAGLCTRAMDEINRLRALLNDCASELADEINARYGDAKHIHRHRYDRDMQTVRAARAAIGDE